MLRIISSTRMRYIKIYFVTVIVIVIINNSNKQANIFMFSTIIPTCQLADVRCQQQQQQVSTMLS